MERVRIFTEDRMAPPPCRPGEADAPGATACPWILRPEVASLDRDSHALDAAEVTCSATSWAFTGRRSGFTIVPMTILGNLRAVRSLAVIGTMCVGLSVAAVVSAAAVQVPAPRISAKPDNVMVNTDTRLSGRNFAPSTQLTLAECAQTNWIAPQDPCDTNNTVTVTTSAKGTFRATMKVEVCPAKVNGSPNGLAAHCFIGVPRDTGVDTIALSPHTKMEVTYP